MFICLSFTNYLLFVFLKEPFSDFCFFYLSFSEDPLFPAAQSCFRRTNKESINFWSFVKLHLYLKHSLLLLSFVSWLVLSCMPTYGLSSFVKVWWKTAKTVFVIFSIFLGRTMHTSRPTMCWLNIVNFSCFWISVLLYFFVTDVKCLRKYIGWKMHCTV